MKFTKVLATTILATTLLAPTAASAATPLWDNPTEYYSLPPGTHDSNKSEKLLKGHTYRVDFEAWTYGESGIFIYTQNRNYLNKGIKLACYPVPYTFLFTPKTDTHLVFEDEQGMGDINIDEISIVEVKNVDYVRATRSGQDLYLANPY